MFAGAILFFGALACLFFVFITLLSESSVEILVGLTLVALIGFISLMYSSTIKPINRECTIISQVVTNNTLYITFYHNINENKTTARVITTEKARFVTANPESISVWAKIKMGRGDNQFIKEEYTIEGGK